MRILATAEDTGSLKEVICRRGTDTSKQTALQPDSIVNHIQESRATKIQQFILYQSKFIIATRLGGSLSIYDFNTEGEDFQLLKKFTNLSGSPTDNFIALFEHNEVIYSCTESGIVAIIDPGNLESEAKILQIPGPVSCFINDEERKDTFAYGGKENDLKIIKIDPNTNKITTVFKAKNVPNDKLDLRVPVWITKIKFTTCAEDKDFLFKCVTITRHGQARYYDSSKSRKPCLDFKISDKPLTTLLKLNDSEVIVSDTHVTTAKFNVKTGVLLGKFQGAVGSIQGTNLFTEGNLLITGGLDRYIRCFDLDSRALVVKAYIGTQINDVLIVEDDQLTEEEIKQAEIEGLRQAKEAKRLQKLKQEENEEEEEEDESSDEEELWNKLESGLTEKRKRRKLH